MNSDKNGIPTLAEWLMEGEYTLAMSSGFFGFYAEAGAYEALIDNSLEPSRFTGSSAGAFVVGLAASGLEPSEIYRNLVDIERQNFWDPGVGKGLLKGELFDMRLREIMPVTTFEEADKQARISVYDIRSHQTEVIDTGDMVLAVRASCAFPGLFHPVTIDGRRKIDGGIKDHSGIAGTDSRDRILHINLDRKRSQQVNRTEMVSVHMPDLPRVSPFNLKRGIVAYKNGMKQMLDALHSPLAVDNLKSLL